MYTDARYPRRAWFLSTSLSKRECVAQLLFVWSIGSSWMISLNREQRKKDSEQHSLVLNTSLRSPLSKRIELARRSDRICSFSSKWPSDDVKHLSGQLSLSVTVGTSDAFLDTVFYFKHQPWNWQVLRNYWLSTLESIVDHRHLLAVYNATWWTPVSFG